MTDGATTANPDAGELICSSRGCVADARWAVRWNNPRIHTPQRRKIWLACDEHRTTLEEYLGLRSFWVDTVAVRDLPDDHPGAPGGS